LPANTGGTIDCGAFKVSLAIEGVTGLSLTAFRRLQLAALQESQLLDRRDPAHPILISIKFSVQGGTYITVVNVCRHELAS
jgi:hypothetical protein